MIPNADPIHLLDPAGGPVPAELRFDLTLADVAVAEGAWGPYRRAARVQHVHWNWLLKFGLLSGSNTTFVGVVCRGVMEGLAQIQVVGKSARLPPAAGDPLVFMEYVESAPWHLRPTAGHPRLRHIGSQLVRGAILISLRSGCAGRIGLHSLAQAEPFYRDKCRMTELGPDPGYNKMRYFEFTAADATAFEQRVPK